MFDVHLTESCLVDTYVPSKIVSYLAEICGMVLLTAVAVSDKHTTRRSLSALVVHD
jgi:hypothetical protein